MFSFCSLKLFINSLPNNKKWIFFLGEFFSDVKTTANKKLNGQIDLGTKRIRCTPVKLVAAKIFNDNDNFTSALARI